MLNFETGEMRRTDLAREMYGKNAGSLIKRSREYRVSEKFSFALEEAEISNTADAEALGRPIGNYITVSSPKLLSDLSISESLALSNIISDELRYLSPDFSNGVTVVGMGNREMTVDSLGARCAEMIKPTRSGNDRGISIVIPGVEASTGISALEIISSVIGTVKPSAVVAIDSLAARSPQSLGTTVQLCNSGISPGSGLGKRNVALNRKTVGIPVISIGVPTVISAKRLISDNEDFYVGLVESDAVIEYAARIIAAAIERAFS